MLSREGKESLPMGRAFRREVEVIEQCVRLVDADFKSAYRTCFRDIATSVLQARSPLAICVSLLSSLRRSAMYSAFYLSLSLSLLYVGHSFQAIIAVCAFHLYHLTRTHSLSLSV